MTDKVVYTEEQLMARLKFVVGLCLAFTLMGIVFVVLYSIIFVTQPLGAISPVDSKFFELIIPIATFLTGTLSGIMLAGNNKDAQMKALEAATAKPTPPSSPPVSDFGKSSLFMAPSFDSPMPIPPMMRREPNLGDVPTFQSSETVMGAKGKLGPKPEPHPEI